MFKCIFNAATDNVEQKSVFYVHEKLQKESFMVDFSIIVDAKEDHKTFIKAMNKKFAPIQDHGIDTLEVVNSSTGETVYMYKDFVIESITMYADSAEVSKFKCCISIIEK